MNLIETLLLTNQLALTVTLICVVIWLSGRQHELERRMNQMAQDTSALETEVEEVEADVAAVKTAVQTERAEIATLKQELADAIAANQPVNLQGFVDRLDAVHKGLGEAIAAPPEA